MSKQFRISPVLLNSIPSKEEEEEMKPNGRGGEEQKSDSSLSQGGMEEILRKMSEQLEHVAWTPDFMRDQDVVQVDKMLKAKKDILYNKQLTDEQKMLLINSLQVHNSIPMHYVLQKYFQQKSARPSNSSASKKGGPLPPPPPGTTSPPASPGQAAAAPLLSEDEEEERDKLHKKRKIRRLSLSPSKKRIKSELYDTVPLDGLFDEEERGKKGTKTSEEEFKLPLPPHRSKSPSSSRKSSRRGRATSKKSQSRESRSHMRTRSSKAEHSGSGKGRKRKRSVLSQNVFSLF